MWFKNTREYLAKAVQRNTGVSSLSLIVVAVGILSVITLLVICVCMLVEMFANFTIASSLEGYAAIIGSVATLVAAVGIPKAINNYGENKFHKEGTEPEEE